MAALGNVTYENASTAVDVIAIPLLVRFWMVLPVYILSLICSGFVIYHFVADRTLRQALHNHVIIIVLFLNLTVQVIGIGLNLNYYRLGYVWPQSPYLCLVWILIDEGFHIAITIFFAWGTIERHILIFHDRLLSTQRKILLFHYLPIGIIFLYCLCYSLIVIIFPPCENTFDYNQLVCGYPLCYYNNQSLNTWDVLVDHVMAVLVIVFGSIGLLLRVLYQKSQMHQPIRWRNYRKMIIQLMSISTLYLVLHAPPILMEFLYLCGLSEEVGADFMAYTEFFEYYSNLLLPFVCAGSIPQLQLKLKKIFLCWPRQTGVVHPT